MYKIKYYNKERVRHDEEGNPIYEIKELQYQCKDTELEYWLNVIKEAYGEHGEITHEHAEDELTKEELEKEKLKAEIKSLKEQLLEVQNYVVDKEYNNLLENGGV